MRRQGTMLREAPPTGWRRGQSATEVILVTPLLVLLLVLVADGGRMFFTYLQVIQAARAGAQYGAQDLTTAGDDKGMETYATAAAPNLNVSPVATNYCCCPSGLGAKATCAAFSGNSKTTYTESCGEAPPCLDWRRYEQVTTTATFKTLFKYPGLPNTLTFNGECTLRSR